ncbi:MAG: isopropylmalate isomerase [Chitinivibrionales bacterium]|nr:isopropylmalate isomerase [Chitinivibrionales bacterium]
MNTFLNELGWRPGIGDPTPMGWLTVAAYFVAAAVCAMAARRVSSLYPPAEAVRQRLFWAITATALVLLGFNKQLDLQSAFTALGRLVARRQNWYDSRRLVQFWFVVVLGLAGAGAVSGALWCLHGALRDNRLVLTGIGLTVTFVLVRAVSFHHVDRFLFFNPAGLRMNWVLELSGIGLVLAAGLSRLRQASLAKHRKGSVSTELAKSS